MRRAKIFEKADERILGDEDFVQEVLATSRGKMMRQYALQAKGVDYESAAEHVRECKSVSTLSGTQFAPNYLNTSILFQLKSRHRPSLKGL